MKSRTASRRAFTLVELLVLIAIIAVVAALQIPALANTKAKVQRVNCSNNLKLVGIAFRTWSASHNDRMPMSVSLASGGALDAIGRTATGTWLGGGLPSANVGRGVWWMFLVMSNELTTPKILYCPSESGQSHGGAGSQLGPQATIFGPSTALVSGFQNDFNVSYFVGVDASETNPNMLLTGDHNLGTGSNQATKVPSFVSAGTNVFWTASAIGWQDNNHAKQGNVCLTDGSVQNLSTGQFREALNKTAATANGVVGPGGNLFNLAVGSTGININRLQFP